MRTCPFHGCEVSLHDAMFACKRHWYSLTRAERDRVYAAYNAYMADRLSMEQLRKIQQEILGERGTA